MPTNVNVSNVKAADPGLGFTLQFNSPLNDTLKVVITISDQANTYLSTSTVTIDNTITDQNMVFVIPFGDSKYNPGDALKFNIQVMVGEDENSTTTVSGIVRSEGGQFNFKSNIPNSVPDGGTLSKGSTIVSIDGNYLGIMQADGNFCAYNQSQLNTQQDFATDSSNTYQDSPVDYCLKIIGGRAFIYDNAKGSPLSASQKNITGVALVIDSNGHFCMQDKAGNLTRIGFSFSYL